jgi:ribonuclease III
MTYNQNSNDGFPPENESVSEYMQLQDNLGYHFKNIEYLKEALTHKSFANEMQLVNNFGNERLEFLGDAVLELIIRHILMQRFPQYSEGKLSNMRAAIVNEESLSLLALKLAIGKHIMLSRGEIENKGRGKKSILANVYEAILAAVYYDGGFESAYKLIKSHFSDFIEEISITGFFRDYKSRLQEYVQKTFNSIPRYYIVTEEGPDHIKMYESQVVINGVFYEKGTGRNKKAAEQDAAEKTLKKLLQE